MVWKLVKREVGKGLWGRVIVGGKIGVERVVI